MKENKWVINVLLIIIMILVVIGCGVAYLCFTNDVEIIEYEQESLFSKENYPKVDGASVTLALAEAFKANFTGINIEEVEIEHSNAQNAFVKLLNKETDLILVPAPSEEEQKLAKMKGINLEIVPIVKDAFVFFVNENNPIENLSLNQVQNIYSGKIKNWKDVGSFEKEILAFQRPESSASQKGMEELIMKGVKMMTPITETVFQQEADIVDIISDYDNMENAIGYSYYYYASTIYTDDEMKLLSVNGIKPSYDNIQTGLYSLQTQYFAVIRKNEPENSNTRKLLNAMISEQGQNIAKEAGYVQNY